MPQASSRPRHASRAIPAVLAVNPANPFPLRSRHDAARLADAIDAGTDDPGRPSTEPADHEIATSQRHAEATRIVESAHARLATASSRDVALERPVAGPARQGRRSQGIPL